MSRSRRAFLMLAYGTCILGIIPALATVPVVRWPMVIVFVPKTWGCWTPSIHGLNLWLRMGVNNNYLLNWDDPPSILGGLLVPLSISGHSDSSIAPTLLPATHWKASLVAWKITHS